MSVHRWHHRRHRLAIQIGRHIERVPEPIEGLLINTPGALTIDVGADLLRLDSTLTVLARTLRDDTEAAARTVIRLRADRDRRLSAQARPRNTTNPTLTDALNDHARLVEQLDDVIITTEVLREFVISLGARDGLLGEAAAGWQLDPAPPSAVEIFLDESLFAHLDSRRQRPPRWGTTLAGIEIWGAHWRRDPDDEPSELEPYRMTGNWVLGYVPTTAEIYAVRRTPSEPHTLWLLGTGFTDIDTVTATLAPIMSRMRGPNSLILAAETVRAAQLARLFRPAVGGA